MIRKRRSAATCQSIGWFGGASSYGKVSATEPGGIILTMRLVKKGGVVTRRERSDMVGTSGARATRATATTATGRISPARPPGGGVAGPVRVAGSVATGAGGTELAAARTGPARQPDRKSVVEGK